MERKTKQKRGGYGVGNKIKMTSNVESVSKIEFRYEVLWSGEKNVIVNYCTIVSSLGIWQLGVVDVKLA